VRGTHGEDDLAVLGEFECVAQEIDDDLTQSGRIAGGQRGDAVGNLIEEVDAFFGCSGGE